MVFERLTGWVMKTGFRMFEPILPVIITYFLSKKMKEWEDKDLIQSFKVKVSRVAKLHYILDLDVYLTDEQARDGMLDILDKSSIRMRR